MERDDIKFNRVRHRRVYSVHLITIIEKDPFLIDCGYDIVYAVNLMQSLEVSKRPHYVDEVVSRVCAKPGCKDASCVHLSHYNGGHHNAEVLNCCIVFGGSTCGWTVNLDLADAITLAHSHAAHRDEDQGTVCSGQTVRIAGLHDTPELNGELGIALHFNKENGRWVVRLWNGEDKLLKPTSLEGLDGKDGRVLCFWGVTRWSRTQLLGEIAKGAWGICMGNVGDLAGPIEERWHNANDRIATAPKTAMTKDYLQDALTELRMPPMGTTNSK
jgi:hypothetical protein